MARPKLVIIDGYSLLFRAFYGTRYLSTSDGRPTNALYGFLSMLFTLLEDQPAALVVALDHQSPTFRHKEYAEYKGTRRETPDELVQQLVASRQFIGTLGIPCLEAEGFEADDVVGTLSRKAEENGYDTYIVTGDLDALQLVDGFVRVVTTRKGVTDVVVYDPDAVRERYGFGPELIPDYKALVGDTSDNIPGVPGIGEKSATLLLQEFGPVESLLQRLAEVPEKFRKKIEPAVSQIPKSKWLATIVRDAPISYGFEPYRVTPDQLEAARQLLTEYEFRGPLRKLDSILAPYVVGGAGTVQVKEENLEPVVLDPIASPLMLRAWVDTRPFGIYLSQPVAANLLDEAPAPEAWIAVGNEVRKVPLEAGLKLFRAAPTQAVAHDAKALYRQSPGLLTPPRFDAMLAGYVLQPGRAGYDLSDLAQGYLEISTPDRPEQLAAALPLLEAEMRDRLKRESQTDVLETMELPLVPILAEMEGLGIAVSEPVLREFSATLGEEIEAVQARCYELAGEPFNIGSPKQIGELLFEKMGIQGAKKTKTGYATGAEILVELAADYPIAREILHYRELTKLKSTYADALPKMIGPDGRIHTSFNQTVAATGRLSSNDPNLQNIPIRTELGRRIREAFVAESGYQLVSFDYSQIELRVLAHMCGDEALVQAFQDRVDVHTVTAALMFHVEQEQVTKEQRRLAKMLNYAVLYGVTDYGLKNQLGEGFSSQDAKNLIEQYNTRFPKVKAFTDATVDEARSKGFTTTLRGRRRTFPDIHAGNRTARSYAERQAMNAPIQGTAADMMKLAMIAVRKRLMGSPLRMLLTVHDELVFEAPLQQEPPSQEIREAMENALPLAVPVEVDGKAGPNWNQMTPLA